jgi:glycosyltransferase involved in cell wall biosynthesis
VRVLHVIPSIGPLRGGPSFVVRALAEGLAQRGVTVDVAATDDNGPERLSVPLGQPIVERGVTYRYFPRQTRFYNASLPLTAWLWKAVPDYQLVHIHALFSYSSTVSAWMARRQHVPYVIRPLGILNQWGMENRRPFLKNLSYKLLERRLLEGAAAIHYTSVQEQKEAEALGFRAPGAIIPNPLESSDRRAAPGSFRAKFPELAGGLLLLFMSRVDEKKGLDLLIPAFARLRQTAPQAKLIIAGSGPEALIASLKNLARKHEVHSDILWTGFLQGDEKLQALADADLFVLPSYSENFGVAAVEALASGLPVVVSDQVAIHTEIGAAGAGLVVPCEVEPLAAALSQCAADPELRRTMGSRGERLAAERFSMDVVCRKILDLYNGVLAS